ncbi:hypothetical protein AB832_04365 [Flavobacteriaceae bacterium (ex Bugula neritina AB1)]|nr:hypothetical protein AB832_04365 [Flavobacteriaceae bacterium (ex Bugula neritina AB1)]
MSTKENTSEEIDLGQLFKLIGDAFNRLFRFIGSVFTNTFHLIIVFLQFLRKHFLKFAIAGFVGLGIGWYLDSKTQPVFRSSMIVEPNFNSTQQLYNNITYYNELAEQGAYNSLSDALNISDKKAETITSVTIESFTDENQKLKQFSEFLSSLDSTSRNIVEYKDYLENFNDINARFHKISIESIDPQVAKKCQKAIVESIESNDYFKSQMKTNMLNLKINDSVIRKQLVEVDSLKIFYQNLKMLEARKVEGTSGTSINLSAENQNLDQSEIILLNEAKSLSKEILEVNKQKAETENIVNIISDFPNKGALVNGFLNKKMILFPIFLILLTFVVLVLLSLNTYLKNYEMNRNN